MTPLQIEILLHYYKGAGDYRGGAFSFPAVREAIDKFSLIDGLLETVEKGPLKIITGYRITKRGEAFIERLCAVPLPS